ncbi:hypothetical protein CR513_62752, partial [Mucuna pruriens]
MASPLKFSMFSACVLVLCVVVAAQYGDGGSSYDSDMPSNMPGMSMGPAPQSSASPRTLTYPTIITILLPFMLTFLWALVVSMVVVFVYHSSFCCVLEAIVM